MTINMQRTDFSQMPCPVARSLERVGEWWSILILRDAFYGLSRFDEFQRSLGVAPNILARRLKALVEQGLLEKRKYQDRPARHDYVLTERGRDFRPVLLALVAWGNRHFALEGIGAEMRNPATGAEVEPAFVDRVTGEIVPWTNVRIAPGPAASERMRRKLAREPKAVEGDPS